MNAYIDTEMLDISSINKLMGIDPHLDPDWQDALHTILPRLDEDSYAFVAKTILRPKGIGYNKALSQYVAQKPKTLAETLKSLPLQNKQLLKAAQELQEICQQEPPPRIATMPYCL